MTYSDLIAAAMRGRGKMEMPQIYGYVSQRAYFYGRKLTKHWRGTVRNTLQRHCKSNGKYQKPNLFIHHGHGTWELRNAKSRRSR